MITIKHPSASSPVVLALMKLGCVLILKGQTTNSQFNINYCQHIYQQFKKLIQ
jgi:hypothetical protein